MSYAEGARRMTVTGRWLVSIALIGSLLFVGTTLALAFTPFGRNLLHPSFALLTFVPLFLSIAILGTILWLAGYIVEGFAQKDQ